MRFRMSDMLNKSDMNWRENVLHWSLSKYIFWLNTYYLLIKILQILAHQASFSGKAKYATVIKTCYFSRFKDFVFFEFFLWMLNNWNSLKCTLFLRAWYLFYICLFQTVNFYYLCINQHSTRKLYHIFECFSNRESSSHTFVCIAA